MRKLFTLFSVIGVLASIASLILAFVQNGQAYTLSLHIFLVSIFLAYCTFKTHELGLFSKTKFFTKFAHIRWTWSDDGVATYEVMRIIKCKRPFIGVYEFKNIWSGRGAIDVTSDEMISFSSSGARINIKYPLSLYFNETKAIKYTIITKDIEKKQKPFINFGGKNPVDIVVLEVILRHKQASPPAKVFMSCADESEEEAKEIAAVAFDPVLHSYRWEKLGVSADTTYWLKWDDAAGNAQGKPCKTTEGIVVENDAGTIVIP